MSYAIALRSLENLLESFLQRVVAAKRPRLQILDGLNRLDDIAKASQDGRDVIESIGEWFADHADWLEGSALKRGDSARMAKILTEIKGALSQSGGFTPAVSKINCELERWSRTKEAVTRKVVLKRGPETADPAADSLDKFRRLLARVSNRYEDLRGSKKHILSVLDDCLQSAAMQRNTDALLLSALIIYYLKRDNYKVGPYIRRLKEAEALVGQEKQDA